MTAPGGKGSCQTRPFLGSLAMEYTRPGTQGSNGALLAASKSQERLRATRSLASALKSKYPPEAMAHRLPLIHFAGIWMFFGSGSRRHLESRRIRAHLSKAPMGD